MNKLKDRLFLSPPHMSGEEMKYIYRAFGDNYIVPLGPNVAEFEKHTLDYLAQEGLYAVAMNSGTAAIHIALRLLNIAPGDEVLCSSATFIASANPILYEKATPVFVDSEPDTWNICPNSLLKAIESGKRRGSVPKALICADLFGMSANYKVIEDICRQQRIEIIEDAAESLGSSYRNRKCGTFGKFGIFSYNGNKIITTSGGGMLITHSKEDAEKALFLITQARDRAPYYLHSEIGYNYRLSNICAGIGLGQMEKLDDRVAARRRNFFHYQSELKDSFLQFLQEPEGYFSNRWLSTALIDPLSQKTPSDIIRHLNAYNIEARHVWKPLHTQPLFKTAEFFHVEKTPVSEQIFASGLCLPSGSNMSEEMLQAVCNALHNC